MASRKLPKTMKKAHKRTFFILVGVIFLAVLLAIFGFRLPRAGGGYHQISSARDMRFGIDIRGGVEAVFAPKGLDGLPTDAQVASMRRIMETRLDNLNVLDRDIIASPATGRVTVRFPWRSDETDFNPDQAIEELGATAQLTFVDPEGAVVLDGSQVVEAAGGVDPEGKNVVHLELNDAGREAFATATAANIGKAITIKMDEIILSEPTVQTAITDGSAIITGMSTPEEAVRLAQQINAGALPFDIEAVSSRSISPQLGARALDVMIVSGAIAFLLLCVFLMLRYRVSGVVASLALLAQVVGILLSISIPQQTLTLQGIAGIILSIGMGVDANVIVAERIREELRGGATVREAVELGFDRAFSSILDGNVTVAVSATCLIIFGSGSLLSFGYSLLVGVILNLVCGATLSHHMSRSLTAWAFVRRPSSFLPASLYGKEAFSHG